MSPPSPARSRAISLQIDELLAEIAFQQVLLSSMDDSVTDRDEAEGEVQAEIKSLERQIRVLRSSLAPPKHLRNPSTPSHHLTLARHAVLGAVPFGSAETLQEPGQSTSSNLSANSTPSPSSSTADMLPSSQSSLPNRKRSHSNHLGGRLQTIEHTKSRRTSPSPYRARQDTPITTSSDDDLPVDFQEEYRKRQLAEEERIERMREDEKYARSIQDGASMAVHSNSEHVSTPSALDRISGIRPDLTGSRAGNTLQTPSFGQLSRPGSRSLPWSKDSPHMALTSGDSSHRTSFGIERKAMIGSTGSFRPPTEQAGFKKEFSPSKIPGAYREDGYYSSDSDIEIISSSHFESKNRHGARNTGLLSAPYPVKSSPGKTAGEAALARWQQLPHEDATNARATQEAFGKYPLPAWMNGNSDFRGLGPRTPSPYVGLNTTQTGMTSQNSAAVRTENGFSPSVRTNGYVYTPQIPGAFPNLDSPFSASSSPSYNPYGLPPYVLNSLNHRMADELDYVMNDPRKTKQEIKDLLENIKPDVELPPENREGTPEGLKYPLYEHQKLALTWVRSQEEGSNKGGILADDMGLGKTITTLALLLSRPSNDRARKTTLIVGPVALIRQWEREIRMKIKSGARLSTHMVHGQTKKLSWDELRNFDIILTTYGTLGAEYRRLVKYYEKHRQQGNEDVDQAPMKKTFPLLGPRSLFYRVVLDEAQCIKNKNSQAAMAACRLFSIHRWCLTGTPMMNNVGELFSLIRFLQIRPYNDWSRFQTSFGMLTKGDRTKKQVDNAMKQLQAVLKAILLRRTKTSLIDGKPIITLPPKTEEIQHVVFNEDEQAFYTALETKTKIAFNKYVRAGTVGKNYSNILVLLLRLRQCCCHPHLIMDFEQASPETVGATLEEWTVLAKSLAPEVVTRLLEAEGFECPVCYDAAENPSIIVPCGHDTCAECLTKISDQAVQQNVANGEGDAINAAKCPTCRGKLDLKSVIDYATFKKVHIPVPQADTNKSEGDDSDSETASDSEADDESGDDGDDNLNGFIVPDDVVDEEEIDEDGGGCGEDEEVKTSPKKVDASLITQGKPKGFGRQKRRRNKSKGKSKSAPKHKSIAMLKQQASTSADGRRRYMKYLRKNWQPSAKIDKCMELLGNFQEEDQKTIVFSQFVSLLDLLEIPINKKEWNCERYDGSMSADARNDAIVRFTDNPDCKIMLISLKAGNAGLNLVAASRVVILDPFWNPYIEMQAVDRAYRIGQQRSVEVHRILIEKTVEDRIIELQEEKRSLVDAALDEGANKSLGRLDERQLAFLFGVNDQ